jgi:hypothetical protein
MGKSVLSNDNAWDDYTCKFNSLSDKLIAAGINVNELIEVISAYENLSREHKTKEYDIVCSRPNIA